eukprot:TRINITY_DN23961_c0_g1_i1.p1 TRINITY_DN23961_c0_g1~~TRINITY_DN23961_c0_g1_i1.p1  ORF type:complete len:179 (+),score=7.69 TRINITY_DN23961_c0_g1_i1:146-682(+)
MARGTTFFLVAMLLASALLSVSAQPKPRLPNLNLAASATAKAVSLVPRPAGMLRGVMTACSGVATPQAGLADIQVTQVNTTFVVTYALLVVGAPSAPISAAVYKGNPCTTAAAVSLALPGNWTAVNVGSYALVGVVALQQADAQALVAEIRPLGNNGLFIGAFGDNTVLAGKLIGGKF